MNKRKEKKRENKRKQIKKREEIPFHKKETVKPEDRSQNLQHLQKSTQLFRCGEKNKENDNPQARGKYDIEGDQMELKGDRI